MSKLCCIIIEDEPLATKVLSEYILQVPFIELQKTFKDAILAIEWLRDNSTDLIFLDIHLPKMNGMAFLKTLSHPPSVIITSAYHQYAIEGFEMNVTDYLLKPIEFDRFLASVSKIKLAHDSKAIKDFIFLTVQKEKVKILFSEILFIESQKEYVKIVTTKKIYHSKIRTHDVEELLPPHLFKRIHRSYIVSVNKIESYTAQIVKVSEFSIPVGKGYREILQNL